MLNGRIAEATLSNNMLKEVNFLQGFHKILVFWT